MNVKEHLPKALVNFAVLIAFILAIVVSFESSSLGKDHPNLIWLLPAACGMALIYQVFRRRKWRTLFWGMAVLFSLAYTRVTSQFVGKSIQDGNRGNLGLIRTAIADYQARHDEPPETLDELTLPPFTLDLRLYPHHSKTRDIIVHHKKSDVTFPEDTGGWVYFPDSGRILINCTHTHGTRHWSAY